MRTSDSTSKPSDISLTPQYLKIIDKPISGPLKEPLFQLIVASRHAQSGDITTAINSINNIIAKDPKFYDAHVLLAQIYEFKKDWISAAATREKISNLDPFNQLNLLQLGEDYKQSGQKLLAKAIISRISHFAPDSPEYSQALKDFKS
jgi:tetratricopeptide (TPR) repeat protein